MTQPTHLMQSTQPTQAGLRITPIDELDRDVIVEAIARLERELFGRGAWSENMVREELAAPARTYYVCVDDNGSRSSLTKGPSTQPTGGETTAQAFENAPAIVGYAGFWYDGDDAELMTIGVAVSHQRRGIAARLLATLVDEAEKQGAARMLLEVRVDNDPALALYRRFGFTRMGLRKRYYQPGNIDAYTMALDLKPRVVGFQTGATDARPEQHEHNEQNDKQKEDDR